jgi:hypothetical protein
MKGVVKASKTFAYRLHPWNAEEQAQTSADATSMRIMENHTQNKEKEEIPMERKTAPNS